MSDDPIICVNCGFQLTPSNMARAKRLPLVNLPPEWEKWAKQQRADVRPDYEWPKFRDYWLGKAGKDAAKLDWFATWRNWIRSAKPSPPLDRPRPTPSPSVDNGPRLSQEERAANRARLANMLATALK